MHSHKTLALLALAASTASPALSAPVLESQQQARASAAASGGGIGSILKTIGTGLGFGALPVVLENVLGGNSTRRDTPHIIVDGLPVPIGPIVPSDPDTTPLAIAPGIIANHIPAPVTTPAPTPIVDGLPVGINGINPRAGIGSVFGDLLDSVSTSGSIGKVLGDGLLGGVASAAGAVGAGELFNLTRREPSQLFDQRDADLVRVLQLVRRDLDERAGVGSVFSSILNAAKTTDSIGSVIGNGILGGVASGAGALGLNSLLDNTRRDGEPHALVRNGVPPQLTAKDLISAFNVVARRLAELD